MSKIQKALNALRKSPENSSEKETSVDLERQQYRLPEPKLPAQVQVPLGDIDEILPRNSTKVDLEALAEAGVFPPKKDAELIAQQFRRIKRPVLQCAFNDALPIERNSNIIMMASAMPGAGKSFCSFNLAYSIAHERDFGSILVDADMLKPGLSRVLGLQGEPGLTDYLVDPNINVADIMVQTDLKGIIIIPAGQSHPEATELLASRRMRDLVSILSQRFRHRAVIFDTPPLLLTNEAQVLAEIVGQIVFVIEARVSLQESVMRALGMLDRDKPINAILNKSRSASSDGYHSDRYGYYPYIGRNVGDEVDPN